MNLYTLQNRTIPLKGALVHQPSNGCEKSGKNLRDDIHFRRSLHEFLFCLLNDTAQYTAELLEDTQLFILSLADCICTDEDLIFFLCDLLSFYALNLPLADLVSFRQRESQSLLQTTTLSSGGDGVEPTDVEKAIILSCNADRLTRQCKQKHVTKDSIILQTILCCRELLSVERISFWLFPDDVGKDKLQETKVIDNKRSSSMKVTLATSTTNNNTISSEKRRNRATKEARDRLNDLILSSSPCLNDPNAQRQLCRLEQIVLAQLKKFNFNSDSLLDIADDNEAATNDVLTLDELRRQLRDRKNLMEKNRLAMEATDAAAALLFCGDERDILQSYLMPPPLTNKLLQSKGLDDGARRSIFLSKIICDAYDVPHLTPIVHSLVTNVNVIERTPHFRNVNGPPSQGFNNCIALLATMQMLHMSHRATTVAKDMSCRFRSNNAATNLQNFTDTELIKHAWLLISQLGWAPFTNFHSSAILHDYARRHVRRRLRFLGYIPPVVTSETRHQSVDDEALGGFDNDGALPFFTVVVTGGVDVGPRRDVDYLVDLWKSQPTPIMHNMSQANAHPTPTGTTPARGTNASAKRQRSSSLRMSDGPASIMVPPGYLLSGDPTTFVSQRQEIVHLPSEPMYASFIDSCAGDVFAHDENRWMTWRHLSFLASIAPRNYSVVENFIYCCLTHGDVLLDAPQLIQRLKEKKKDGNSGAKRKATTKPNTKESNDTLENRLIEAEHSVIHPSKANANVHRCLAMLCFVWRLCPLRPRDVGPFLVWFASMFDADDAMSTFKRVGLSAQLLKTFTLITHTILPKAVLAKCLNLDQYDDNVVARFDTVRTVATEGQFSNDFPLWTRHYEPAIMLLRQLIEWGVPLTDAREVLATSKNHITMFIEFWWLFTSKHCEIRARLNTDETANSVEMLKNKSAASNRSDASADGDVDAADNKSIKEDDEEESVSERQVDDNAQSDAKTKSGSNTGKVSTGGLGTSSGQLSSQSQKRTASTPDNVNSDSIIETNEVLPEGETSATEQQSTKVVRKSSTLSERYPTVAAAAATVVATRDAVPTLINDIIRAGDIHCFSILARYQYDSRRDCFFNLAEFNQHVLALFGCSKGDQTLSNFLVCRNAIWVAGGLILRPLKMEALTAARATTVSVGQRERRLAFLRLIELDVELIHTVVDRFLVDGLLANEYTVGKEQSCNPLRLWVSDELRHCCRFITRGSGLFAAEVNVILKKIDDIFRETLCNRKLSSMPCNQMTTTGMLEAQQSEHQQHLQQQLKTPEVKTQSPHFQAIVAEQG